MDKPLLSSKKQIVVFVLALLVLFRILAHADEAIPEKSDAPISLAEYIFRQGSRLDAFFTIETDTRPGHSPSSIQAKRMIDNPDVKNVDGLIADLKKQLPGFAITKDRETKIIVHIVESSLENNFLDRRANVHYFGGTGGMVHQFRIKTAGAIRERMQLGGVIYDNDFYQTPVDAKGATLRDVLTQCVTLNNPYRVLWSATTSRHEDGDTVDVDFVNAESWGPWQRKTTGSPVEPFSRGGMAYQLNYHTESNIAAAHQFIDTAFKTNATHQVHWAMFFLGTAPGEAAIPVLMEHLDYQFVPSQSVSTRYPAVGALVNMGAPAAKAALQQLATETDRMRLDLLCEVVLQVMDKEKGRVAIETAANGMADTAQKEKVLSAQKRVDVPPFVNSVEMVGVNVLPL